MTVKQFGGGNGAAVDRLHLTPALTSLRLALVTTRPSSVLIHICIKETGRKPCFFWEKNMNALLLLAALSSQITFIRPSKGICTPLFLKSLLLNLSVQSTNIVPARRQFRAKSDEQEKTLSLPANQPIALTKLS